MTATDHVDLGETPSPPPVVSDGALTGLLVLDGVLLGAFGLVFTPLYAGSVPVPLGALLSILILPWLVRRAGEVAEHSALVGAPLWGWLAVVVALGITGPGGDVLLAPTWQSLLLVVGGTGAGLLALRSALGARYGRRG